MIRYMFDKLRRLNLARSVVIMPDFFIDRIIKLKSKEELFGAVFEKAKHGGGSIRGIQTKDVKGGNAVNTAYCLAKLGMRVTLFTVTDEIGTAILKTIFSKFGDKVNLQISYGKHGGTTAIEFLNEKGSKVNVMVSDVGDNADFGPERVTSEEHLKVLDIADAVVVMNWGSNLKGTQLAEYVFKNSPKYFHFLDPADIESRKEEFLQSLKDLNETIDVLSINENECNSLARSIGFEHPLIPSGNYNKNHVENAPKSDCRQDRDKGYRFTYKNRLSFIKREPRR